MLTLIAIVFLYVFGFVLLYGVVRLAVRHGMEDLEARRNRRLHGEQLATLQERTFARENAFLTGS